MKISSIKLVVFFAIATTAILAQDSANELPSAPSAVKQAQTRPQPSAPPTTPAESKPTEVPAPTPVEPEKTQTPDQGGNAASGSILETPKETPENNPDFNIPVRVNEVNVVFTVTDRHGRLIKDLSRNDFKVQALPKPDASARGLPEVAEVLTSIDHGIRAGIIH